MLFIYVILLLLFFTSTFDYGWKGGDSLKESDSDREK